MPGTVQRLFEEDQRWETPEELLALVDRLEQWLVDKGLPRHLAEEDARDVMVNALDPNGPTERFHCWWVWSAARNRFVSRCRRREVETRHAARFLRHAGWTECDEPEASGGEARAEPTRRRIEALFQAIAKLDDTQRGLLRKRVSESRTIREIAAEEGVTPKAIEKRITRIYRRIRSSMDPPEACA